MASEQWWAVRRSGGRGEAGFVLFVSVLCLAVFGWLATVYGLSAHGVARLVTLAVIPGAFLVGRSIVDEFRCLVGLMDRDRSGEPWTDLVYGTTLLGIAFLICWIAGFLAG